MCEWWDGVAAVFRGGWGLGWGGGGVGGWGGGVGVGGVGGGWGGGGGGGGWGVAGSNQIQSCSLKHYNMKKWPFAYFVNMEHFCHTNTYHLKVSNTFSKFNHTVNQNTGSLTLTTTSFLKETCYFDLSCENSVPNYAKKVFFMVTMSSMTSQVDLKVALYIHI